MIPSFFIQTALAFILAKTISTNWKTFLQNDSKEEPDLQTENTLSQDPQNKIEESHHFSQNSLDGFFKLQKGILEGNVTLTSYSISEILKKTYCSSSDLIHDFTIYVEIYIKDAQKKEFIKQRLEKDYVKKCIRFSLGESVREQVVDAQNSLKHNNDLELRDYAITIENIYNRHLGAHIRINNYTTLLGKVGCIYEELSNYNKSLKLTDDIYGYDHVLIYKIAEYIIEHKNYYFCRGLSKERLAKDITDNIIKYLDANHKLISDNFTIESDYLYNKELLCNYYLQGEIDTYYNLLNICGKLYNEIYQYNIRKGISQKGTYDHKIPQEIALWILTKTNFTFLGDITQIQLAADITNNIFSFLENLGNEK